MSSNLYRMSVFDSKTGEIKESSVLTEDQFNEILEKQLKKHTKKSYIVVATSWKFGVVNLYYTGKMFQLEGVKYPQLVEDVTKAKRYKRQGDAERMLDKSLIYDLEVYTLYEKTMNYKEKTK